MGKGGEEGRLIAQLLGADRRQTGDQHQFVGGRQLHHLARRQQRARRLLAADHDVTEPGRQPVTGIVALGAQFGGGAERIGNPFGGALIVGRESDADMAVIEDGVVFAVGLGDLIEALRDQIGADAVPCHEGQRSLEKVQPTQRRKLVQHHQQLVFPPLAGIAFQPFGEPPPDLIEDQAHQRFGA